MNELKSYEDSKVKTLPHPASARPYQASLTKNVLPLERSGARLTEREQGKAKKERGWPAIVKIYIYLRRKKQGDKRRQNYPERLPTQSAKFQTGQAKITRSPVAQGGFLKG
ncbi:hypothetical protein J6590_036529 [Homalodisca vitripennis]|nr:hypothetical protein J6590_036529 [Homalodisca vitripennis]